LISDYDGPVNYTVGIYNYQSSNDNETNIATGAGGMLSDVGDHAYFPTLQFFSGGQIVAGEGGAAYFQSLATWFATLQALGPTHPATAAALASALDNSGKTTPRDGHGLIIDNHIKIEEKSLFGEVYFDISDDTKLTLGLRYDEADVSQKQINDRFGSIFHAIPFTTDALLSREQRDAPFFTSVTEAPADGTAYKIAVQHNLNDNSMVYASFSTAMKPGGINTGNDNQVLKEENVDNFEVGLKSILANGAVLLNTTVFSTNIDNYQVGVIVDTGSDAANATAEMKGFEGNLSAFLSETTRIDFNWLLTDAEFSEDAFIIDYLNPGAWVEGAVGGENYAQYGAIDSTGVGLMYAAVGITASGQQVPVYKQAGFSCLTPNFSPLTAVNCPEGSRGIAQNVKGNPLPGTPELSYSLSFNQSFPTANGSVNSKLSYRYQDQYSGDAFNTERARNQEQDFFDFLVTYVPNDGDWYFGVYAKNLEDKRYLTSPGTQSNVQGGGVVWQVNDPSIYGIQFGTSF
jgi:outer membrane receptor protein involved in Fe transport